MHHPLSRSSLTGIILALKHDVSEGNAEILCAILTYSIHCFELSRSDTALSNESKIIYEDNTVPRTLMFLRASSVANILVR